MKIIKACLILNNHKDHHTNSNTNSQAGDVDSSVSFVSYQASECGFKIVSEHTMKFLISDFMISDVFTIHYSLCHSILKLFTGFASDTFIV